jgi:hypothetical protein
MRSARSFFVYTKNELGCIIPPHFSLMNLVRNYENCLIYNQTKCKMCTQLSSVDYIDIEDSPEILFNISSTFRHKFLDVNALDELIFLT